MTHSPIRPMNTGEIIVEAFRLFKANLMLLVVVALLPQLGLVLVHYGIARIAEGSPSPMPVLLPLLILQLILTVAGEAITLSAITTAVAGAVLGFPPTVVQTYSLTFRNRLPWVIVGNVVTALIASVGLLFLIYPGLILGGYMAATVPVIVLESKKPFAAIARSFALMRPNLPKAIAIFGFGILITKVIPLFLLVTVGNGPLFPLLGAVIGAVTLPLAYTANTILYFSVRAGEGYTPEKLAEELSSRVTS